MDTTIAKFVENVTVWNREVFSNIFQRKIRVLARLGGIKRALETHSTHNLQSLEMELKEELEILIFKRRSCGGKNPTVTFLIWEIRTPSTFMPRQRAELSIHTLRCFER